jgi:basic membrane protein A
MKKLYLVMVALIVASMVLTACGPSATPTPAPVATEAPAMTEAPAATEAPAMTEAPKMLVGEVTDLGGIDDKSFNANGWKGVQEAMTDFGVDGKYLESQ